MEFRLPFPKISPAEKIKPSHKIMLIGSCFSEHISKRLKEIKCSVLSNPHGIIYTPLNIACSLEDVLVNKPYAKNDLICEHGIWHQWHFHSSFSGLDAEGVLKNIHLSIAQAHTFLQTADWLVLTVGSAFQYYYKQPAGDIPVANCHKVAAKYFDKKLLQITDMVSCLETTISRLRQQNPKIKIVWTVSPVRHIRDGLIENNRSKARLLEAIHQLNDGLENSWYFPAYEILIDALRDYRFYDKDWVHPGEIATASIWEQFMATFFSEKLWRRTNELSRFQKACAHRPRFVGSDEYQKFITASIRQAEQLEQQFPELNLSSEKGILLQSL